jgi:hemerythrin
MNSVGKRLSQDHQQLAALLEALSQAAEACDREALVATWAELEPRLICHMEAEERYLLPLVEADYPAEVSRTLLEHAQIRDRIAELGLAVELHAVRAGDIRALIEVLQAHSKHEDEALYTIAGDKVSVAVEHSVLSTLKTALRSALRSAS